MGNTDCAEIFRKNKEKDEGTNTAKRPIFCKGKDKENGSNNPGVGKLLLDSESQKQDAGIRWTGKNAITDRDMEAMEEGGNENA